MAEETQEAGVSHLYRDIAESIKRRILEGEYAPSSKLPGSRDFSIEFSTTPVTIDRALALLVEDGLVRRVPKSGSFVMPPGERAESSRQGGSGLVAAIAFDATVSVYWSAVTKAMEDAFLDNGYHMVVAHGNGDVARTIRIIADLVTKGIQGFVFVPFSAMDEATYESENAAIVDALGATGHPFILFDRGLGTRSTSLVSVRNREFARQLARRLLDMGCRRPLCVSSSYSRASEERESGFLDACAERGIANPERFVRRVHTDRMTPEGYDELSVIVRESEADAYFIISSNLGNAVADVLSTMPEYSTFPLAGFEDYEMRMRKRFSFLAKFSVYDSGFVAGALLSRMIGEAGSALFKGTTTEIRLPCHIEQP